MNRFADTRFPQESFLVEVRSIGGYSGSPVFVFIPPASPREGVKDWVPHGILRSHGPWLLGLTGAISTIGSQLGTKEGDLSTELRRRLSRLG